MDTQTINENNKADLVTRSVRIDQDVYAAIENLAVEEDRPSIANMIERLLKTHPRVKKQLEAETAGATA